MSSSLSDQFAEVLIAKRRAEAAIEDLPREQRGMIQCLMHDMDLMLAGDLRSMWNAYSRVEQLAREKLKGANKVPSEGTKP